MSGATGLAADDAALLAQLARSGPTSWHRLNPLTKVVAVAATTVVTLAVGAYAGPLLGLALLVLPAAFAARVAARVVRLAVLASLPIVVSVALVSVFTRPGGTVLFVVGPFDATLEGVDFAARVSVRLVVLAAAAVLFALTTEPRALLADLERRSVPPRVTFGVVAVLDAVPELVERARTVRDAQRSRGLDTEGSVGARLRGVVPLVGPAVALSLAAVEDRSLALELRAFGRPGARSPLWVPPDSARQRLARWLLAGAVTALLVARLGGRLPELP